MSAVLTWLLNLLIILSLLGQSLPALASADHILPERRRSRSHIADDRLVASEKEVVIMPRWSALKGESASSVSSPTATGQVGFGQRPMPNKGSVVFRAVSEELEQSASFMTSDDGWYYPAFYLGDDGRELVEGGKATGRPFEMTFTGVDNLIGADENNEMVFHGHVDGPNELGWDLWNDEHCLKFDFGFTFDLSSEETNVEGLLSRVEVDSGGFPSVMGYLRFYDDEENLLGSLGWNEGEGGQVKTERVSWSRLRYVWVCMNTGLSSDTPWDGWIEVKYIKVKPASIVGLLPKDQTFSPDECPLCNNAETRHYVGGPIDTYSGNYNYQTTDVAIPTLGYPLEFERAYNSYTVTDTATGVYTRPLGYGWTHNYDVSLIFPADPAGEEGTLILEAPHGSRLRFQDNGDGTYSPYPGVWASLSKIGAAYIITAVNQTVYTFESLGSSSVAGEQSPWLRYLDEIGSGEHVGDEFGLSVTVDKHGALVGIPGDDTLATEAGAADRLVSAGQAWTRTVKLTAGDGAGHDRFGFSVATDGETMIVGVPGRGNDAGAAYIFVRSGLTWTQQAKLTAAEGHKNDRFGTSVAVSGDYAIVGAPDDRHNGPHSGAAYIFVRNGLTWTQQARLTVSEGLVRDRFGQSVAIEGTEAVVGMPGADGVGTDAGAVVVFGRQGMTWTQEFTLTAGEGAGHDLFGYSLALRGNELVVGAPEADVRGNKTGAAYVFVRDGTGWTEQAQLTAADGEVNDRFGFSVALGDGLALTGAPRANDQGNDSGAVYLFVRRAGVWMGEIKLLGREGDVRDLFGSSVAVSGGQVVIGAPGVGKGGIQDRGAVYAAAVSELLPVRLVSIRDPRGNATHLTYTLHLGRIVLERVSDPSGSRWLEFGYDTEGQLTTLSDHSGRSVRYGYDGLHRLTVVTDTRGLVWRYEYSGSASLLHAVVEPGGRVVERTYYDGEGRVIRQENGAGEAVVQIAYPDDFTRVVVEYGRVLTDTYDGRGLLVGQIDAGGNGQAYGLDGNFNRTTSTDALSNTTHYARNEFGYTTVLTDALGYTAVFTYGAKNNLTASRDARGYITRYSYDENNNLTEVLNPLGGTAVFTYNVWGQVTAAQNENGHVTRFAYDEFGNTAAITDALGNVTTFGYDELGRLITTTNALGRVTRHEYDAGDNLIRVTENYTPARPQNYRNIYNLITEYAYDGAHRPTFITDTLGEVTKYDYDPAGRLSQVTENYLPGRPQNYQDEYNLVTQYEYDDVGRLILVTDTLGRRRRNVYDERNLVARTIVNYVDGVYDPVRPDEDLITRYGYDANGNLIHVIDPLGRVTRSEYDALNRMVRLIRNYRPASAAPDANLTTWYEYDPAGNLSYITDPLGQVTAYQYDPLNRLSGVIENYVTGVYSGLPDRDVTTRYGYDAVGNRTVITDGNGYATHYTYDALDRLTAEATPLGHRLEYGYDPLGNRTVITDAEGQVANLSYDALNRLRGVQYPDSAVEYGYDPLGNRTAMTDTTGVTTYVYDTLHRPLTITAPMGGVVGYRYDAVGNRTHLIYPSGKVVTYTYDAANRLLRVEDWNGGETEYSYDAAGRLRATGLPNGVRGSYGYDGAGRLTAVRWTNANRTARSYLYTVDGAGNRVRAVEAVFAYRVYLPLVMRNAVVAVARGSGGAEEQGSGVFTGTLVIDYSYDGLYRLTGADYSTGERYGYTYDAVGNRLTYSGPDGSHTYAYDAADRLTSVDGVAYTWDDRGNQTSDGTLTYAYDSANRLVGVSEGGLHVTYTYDGDGLRVSRAAEGETTHYTWDVAAGLPQLLTDGDTLYLPGVGQYSGGEWAYYLADGLGSVRQVVDGAGAVVQRYGYSPFGWVVAAEGSWANPLQYTGEQWDGDVGLLYLRARWYDPGTGRFLSKDPFPGLAALPQTQHPYVYVGNNPVLYVDPSGEFVLLPLLLVAAAGGALGGLGYYGLQVHLQAGPCGPQWDWGEALFWGGVGTGLGALLGTGIYGGWWVGVQAGWWGPAVSSAGTTYLLAEPSRINWPWHHIFPQRADLAGEFMRRGVDINKYLMQLPVEVHRVIHGEGPRGGLWNQAWEAFFAANPTATAEEIYKYAGWLIYTFNLEGVGRLIIR